MARPVSIESDARAAVRQDVLVRLRVSVSAQQTIRVQRALPPDQVRISKQFFDQRFSCEVEDRRGRTSDTRQRISSAELARLFHCWIRSPRRWRVVTRGASPTLGAAPLVSEFSVLL